jgi:hypothetical protein
LTRAVVNKLLHEPMLHLRAERRGERGDSLLVAARELFGGRPRRSPSTFRCTGLSPRLHTRNEIDTGAGADG